MTILLLNFDHERQQRLTFMLRTLHQVLFPEALGKSLPEIQKDDLQQVDYIICDLTCISADVWRELRRICRFRQPAGVGCWSRTYRGAEFELLVETDLGARLVYGK